MKTTTTHHFIAADFSRTVRAQLSKRGITVIGSTNLPGPNGDYANGQRGYQLSDNGCMRIRTYAEVRAIVEG